MKVKGVAPLIAFVFLVLFAITISIVVGGWIIPLTEDQAKNVKTSTQLKLSCQYANLYITSAMLNCSNSCLAGTRHNLTIQIKNTGSIPLTLTNAIIQNKTGVTSIFNWNETKTISSNSILTLENNSFTSCSGYDNQTKMEKITVNSVECPGAYDSISSSYVSFDQC